MNLKLALLTFSLLPALALGAAHFPGIIDADAMKDVDPCTDFYQYSCGGWIDATTIPADKKSVSRQVTPLADATDETLNKILAAYAKGDFSVKSTHAKKLGDFYAACMNADAETAGALETVKGEIKNFNLAHAPRERAALVAKLHLGGAGVLFGFGSAQDLDDSTRVIGDVAQGGMGLPDREYYLKTDAKSVEIRAKYVEYVAQLFVLLGDAPAVATARAGVVLKFETALAKVAYSIADKSDPSKTHHPIGRTGLKQLAPHFDWDAYFEALGAPTLQVLNVDEPEFFAGLDALLVATSAEDVDTYLAWIFANRSAPKMGGTLAQTHFDFWNAYLNGTPKPLPRWKSCTQAVESSLGYALAEAYVGLFDGAAIKSRTEEMVTRIKSAFSVDLTLLDWMDVTTSVSAGEKVSLMAQKVGAPVKWRNYDSLVTQPTSYLASDLAVVRFEGLRDLAKIGKPVDKDEWLMMPWEVNAYYDRSNNEFVFPFGILQPPSLDLAASQGANYGSFGGGTIGHELTHGFDNNGSQYDGHGNLRNWWSDATKSQFDKRASCYINQANGYRIESVGLNVNGAQTLEENLADQGGVKLGYVALEKLLAEGHESAPLFGRFTERQQYWLAYAQSWCTKATPESLRVQIATDVHPPAEFRVNAVVMNRPEFQRDFKCSAGATMAPADRCALW